MLVSKQDINTILVLNPKEKMRYFKKHWSSELQDDVIECVEEVVCHTSCLFIFFRDLIYVSQFRERYLSLSSRSSTTQLAQPNANRKLNILLRELSDDEETTTEVGSGMPDDPKRPWLTDFHKYLDVVEQVPDGCSAIGWWGVRDLNFVTVMQSDTDMTFQLNAQRYYPAWSSLARDYLVIMSSSFSSERAFSQGGITISKLRSCLKGDIVEALQCIKYAIQSDLLFPEPAPSSVFEAEVNKDGEELDIGEDAAKEGWDDLLIEDEDEDPVVQIDTDLDAGF